MGMVVRSNIMAVNAQRQLGMNNSQVSKSLEKLSSGFRINRAGDDASGLAISEKMKAQIKGLETASSNSQDGISLIQTAEGALTEVHDMLNRMVEIAGKAANGTMDDDTDRAALQKEVDALKSEIDRIAQGTNFNGMKLLDGTMAGGGKAAVKAEYKVTLTGVTMGAGQKLTIAGVEIPTNSTPGISNGDNAEDKVSVIVDVLNNNADFKKIYTAKVHEDGKGIVITAKKAGEDANKSNVTVGGDATGATNGAAKAQETTKGTNKVDPTTGLTLQIGDTADAFNKILVSVEDMSTKGLAIEDISVEDQTAAATALDQIKTGPQSAINLVSDARAALGAAQNRLEHTINNLDVATENMTSANSRIRDTDMAKQMMDYTKMNVLTQAAQAMLAQANQQPQSVLQLLQ